MSGSAPISVDLEDARVVGAKDARRRSVGRQSHTVWSDFSTDTDAHRKRQLQCMHCSSTVTVHKKVDYAKSHLMKCKDFKKEMMSMDPADRPEWYAEEVQAAASAKRAKAAPSESSGMSSVRQISIHDFAVPKISKSLQDKVDNAMAMHYYITGSSFARIEEPHLLMAFQALRPDVKLPTRKKLAGPLLDRMYSRLKYYVDLELDSASSVCLTTDGWTNVENEPVVNYMAVANGTALFIESVNTGEQSHDAVWIAADTSRVLTKFGDRAAGCLMDNTATNRAAWKILEENHPSKFFYGCTSHCLHLLTKDIFAATKTKRGRGSAVALYPDGYPFEQLLKFALACKEIVKFFHNHHVEKAQLTKALKDAKLNNLQAPAPTRWGTLLKCFETLLAAENILNEAVTKRDFIEGTARQKQTRKMVRETVTDVNFVQLLEKSIGILSPIDIALKVFQSDKVAISVLYPTFVANLPAAFKKLKDDGVVTAPEERYLQQLVVKRFEFVKSRAHTFAYVLDPRYAGALLSLDDREYQEEKLCELPSISGLRADQDEAEAGQDEEAAANVLKTARFLELTNFMEYVEKCRASDNFRYKMLLAGSKSPAQFWQVDGKRWPLLRVIGTTLFSLVASTAASERNFSTFGFIHSKLRNSLGPEKVQKLVFVKHNGALMCNVDPECCMGSDDEVDSDDDVDESLADGSWRGQNMDEASAIEVESRGCWNQQYTHLEFRPL